MFTFKQFLIEKAYIECPFPNSLEKRVLFHGTQKRFSKFIRAEHGIYVTPVHSWARTYYGSVIIPLYANVTKRYQPTEEEIDLFYDMDYKAIATLLTKLSTRGYNCCLFGGESESMVLFNNIEIVNAITGKPM